MCILLWAQLAGQNVLYTPKAGFEFTVPGPSLRYPAVSIGAWSAISQKSALSIEAGYGGRGLFFRRERIDNTFQQTHRRWFISALYIRHLESHPWIRYDFSMGPYFMAMEAEIGKSFIDDLPDGALTAHSGADYRLQRYGILPGVGFKTFTGRASFGARMQFPVFYEESDFRHIQNPLLVLDFHPSEIEDYQRDVSQVSAGFVLSVSVGFTFNRRDQD